jgi:serine/threonine protein kinase
MPSYPSRNDMKRSMVIQGSFDRLQSPPPFLLQRKESKAKKAVSADDFVKIRELGNGKYGRVSLVFEKLTGFVCALKKIEKKLLVEEEITEQFLREVKIQMFLSHPNIVKMYGFFDDAAHIYIIMEVGMGGQLFHQIKKALPLQEPRAAVIMRQVCEAVNEIHSCRIIHRDIKPENIVVHEVALV